MELFLNIKLGDVAGSCFRRAARGIQISKRFRDPSMARSRGATGRVTAGTSTREYISPVFAHSCGSCRGIPKYWKLTAPKLTTASPVGWPLEVSNRWAGTFLLKKVPWINSAHALYNWCHFLSVTVPEDEWVNPGEGQGWPHDQPYDQQAHWMLACEFGIWFMIAWATTDRGVGVHNGVYSSDPLFRDATGRDTTSNHDPRAIIPHNISIWFLRGARFKCQGKNEFYFYDSGPSEHPYPGYTESNPQQIVTVEPFWP